MLWREQDMPPGIVLEGYLCMKDMNRWRETGWDKGIAQRWGSKSDRHQLGISVVRIAKPWCRLVSDKSADGCSHPKSGHPGQGSDSGFAELSVEHGRQLYPQKWRHHPWLSQLHGEWSEACGGWWQPHKLEMAVFVQQRVHKTSNQGFKHLRWFWSRDALCTHLCQRRQSRIIELLFMVFFICKCLVG